MSTAAASAIASLRRETLRLHPELSVDDPSVQCALEQQIEERIDRAEEVRLLGHGERAALILHPTSTAFYEHAQHAFVEIAQGDDEAYAWIAQQFRELRPRLQPSFEMMLDVSHRALLAGLAESALAPRLHIYYGDPKVALEVTRHYRARPRPRNDVRLVPLTDEAHVEPIVRLLREHFRKHRYTGYLSPAIDITEADQTRIDTVTRKRLTDAIGARTTLVALRSTGPSAHDVVMGYAACYPRIDPVLGHVGGIAIAFDESLHGYGLSWHAYDMLLSWMVERGVEILYGRTANQAVVHMAKRMGRPLRGYQIEPCTA